MRKLALTTAVAAATLVAAPAVDAHPVYHYEGGCSATAVSHDFSNPPTWTVSIDIAAVATESPTGTPALVEITVECHFNVNGTWGSVVASAHSPLTAVVAHVSVPLVADWDDTVDICHWVGVGGDGHLGCAPVTFVHPDDAACSVIPGDDVKLGDKSVYDCPPYSV